ncbi:MAG: type I-U CRISPR-associated protein Csx17 [Methanothrix sp.]
MKVKLHAVHFGGIRADSLGSYLTGLGLLSACAKRWPDIRGCWCEWDFALFHTNVDSNKIYNFLLDEWDASQYPTSQVSAKGAAKVFWTNEQKADTKAGKSKNIQKLRSSCNLNELRFLDSHLISITKNVFNPVFGTGGNIGRRSLAKVSLDAKTMLNNADPENKSSWLNQTLFRYEASLPELQSTGTWFVQANKTYNSGQSNFFREGRLSPWSFLLALEGGLLLIGAAERRLTAKARPYAVFPFITESACPTSENEMGLKQEGEFWAPLWDLPASLTEVRYLLHRGLARVGNRNATSPHEFGAAALGEGVDAGISAFAPFELRETTSSQVFEAIPRNRISIIRDVSSHAASEHITELISWLEHLPFEETISKGRFSGLRGPIEQAIRSITEKPDDSSRWQFLLLQLAEAQRRIDQDRTRDWRKTCIALPRLSIKWLDFLWPDQMPDEVRIACSIASLGAESISPLLVNIFGVEINANGTPILPKNRPFRAIWGQGPLVDQLVKIMLRRLIDAKNEDQWPLEGTYHATFNLVGRFLSGAMDEEEISNWLPALSLLDWRTPSINNHYANKESIGGVQLLDGFFRPLLTSGLKWDGSGNAVEPKLSFALRLVNALQQDDLENAVDLAISRIRSLGGEITARPLLSDSSGQRLAASQLLPLSLRDISLVRDRWLQPMEKRYY